MPLTTAQKTTLKSYIRLVPELDTLYVDGNLDGLALRLNADASPAFIVWKTEVPKNEVGKTFVASALAAITAANNDKLANFAAWNETVNPSRSDQRQFFDDVFSVSAGASTRAALLVLWKRNASVLEKLFATGTGSDDSPATMVFEGALGYQELIGL
ncbi:hypothetical protein [Immundisolibacter sp.]